MGKKKCGRKSTLQKLEEANQQEEMTITKVESFAINPNIDYSQVSSVIAQVESQFDIPMNEGLIQKPHLATSDETWSSIREANPQAFDTMTDIDKIGHQHIIIDSWRAPKTVIGDEPLNKPSNKVRGPSKDLPPLHNDFLAFLIEKNPKSFGWVIEPSFFTNFQCDPSGFTEKEQFIFWIVPSIIQTVKTANSVGFQRSETRSHKIHPHVFLIKLLESKAGEAEADPFIEIINDPSYLKLRENLEERGMEFLFDYNPSRLWLNGLSKRLNKN